MEVYLRDMMKGAWTNRRAGQVMKSERLVNILDVCQHLEDL
jgi:hypothetical protein